MNYLKEILAFMDLVQLKQLTPSHISLWHALMHVNNKSGWQEWFSAPNKMLELSTGMDRSSIYRARNVLKQLGAIDFRPNGNKATFYTMISLAEREGVQFAQANATADGTAPATSGGRAAEQHPHTLNKLNINKTKERGENARARFTPPTLEEVTAFCKARGNGISAERFVSFYASKGWMVGKNRMKDWKQAVISWELKDKTERKSAQEFMERDETLEQLRAKIDDPLKEIMEAMS